VNLNLKKYINSVKSDCLRLGFSMKVNETAHDTVALLSNPKSDRVVIVFFDANIYGDALMRTYLVNRPKYNWASAEGFSLNEMLELIDEKVFIEVDPAKVGGYLL
jgi:hypothetical protein